MGKKIGMISLGCAKNQVNAEQMMFLLQEAGYDILPTVEEADVVIINTCSFIDSAKSEAIDNILAMGGLKAEGLIGKILVTGCLSQRYRNEILEELPEVDGVLGTGSYGQIVPVVEQLLKGETVSLF
ncbi:MAG: 30S ribosomal protein S12 methylthiotransferase RimO, partial [Oscillospiraceae bacterium]|nr:30S ribosomal protein S12 methylthiotransferase RimO [Oscillospiraceae bacterium]